jgi:hypothetical protein
MANVPADELVAEKTGLLMPPKKKYSRGLLMPPLDQRYHEESERYFDRYRYSRQEVPDSYSSVAEGKTSVVDPDQIQICKDPKYVVGSGSETVL